MENIAFQPELRPVIPTVYGPKDYNDMRETFEQIDRILIESGVEHSFIARKIISIKDSVSYQKRYKTYWLALRYGILLAITGFPYRQLAAAVADSNVFQWFVGAGHIDGVRPLSKSSIERFEKLIPAEEIMELVDKLNKAVADEKIVEQLLYREAEMKMDRIFADTTCMPANIHFPVDWLLLRDATKTLMKSIVYIRKHGLKHRIADPKSFIRQMNKLCMEMTQTRRKKDALKTRKKVFRKMKKLIKTVESHGNNYRKLLAEHWRESDLSEAEAQVVLDRMDCVLLQLPDAVKQAHERIIGGRRVRSEDKILSLYESEIHVIVRGKAGAEVEFGNTLYLAEQEDGLIVDWELHEGKPPADSKLVESSMERIEAVHGRPESFTADRGFDAKHSRGFLEKQGIDNGICPRSVSALQEKLDDEGFRLLQWRRSQTEGRIGIFKNAYLGRPLPSKGFEHRKTRLAWCVLAHNLWKLGKVAAEEKNRLQAQAI